MTRINDVPAVAERPARLRVVYCTRGGLFGARVLQRLAACEDLEVCAIVRSSRTVHASYGFLRGAAALIHRSGLSYALYLLWATTLTDLLARLLSAPPGASRVPQRPRSGWRTSKPPTHVTHDLNDPAGLEFLRNCAPDLLVSAFFDQRLKPAALAIPRHGCINLHPSLLPQFGGVDPVLQALGRGAPLGVSVHYMDAGLDTGALLAQQALVVAAGASVFEATARLFDSGAQLLCASVGKIRHGDIGASQHDSGSYQGWPTRAQVRQLRATGHSLLRPMRDWRYSYSLLTGLRTPPMPETRT